MGDCKSEKQLVYYCSHKSMRIANSCFERLNDVSQSHFISFLSLVTSPLKFRVITWVWWKYLVTRWRVSSCGISLLLSVTFQSKDAAECRGESGDDPGERAGLARGGSRVSQSFDREEPLRGRGAAWNRLRAATFLSWPAGATLSCYKSSPYLAPLVSSSEPSQHRSSCSDS